MIAFLKGEIEELEEAKVLLDVNGVGYGVFITGGMPVHYPADETV